MKKDSDLNRWWRAAEVVLIVALFALPWSLGGAPPWSQHLLVGVSAAASLLWVVGARHHGRRWGSHPALIVPVVTAAFALVQLVPLPPALLAALSRPAAELRDFALVPLGLDAWRPLTLDVPSTERALARALALGGLLFVAHQLGRVEVMRERLLRALGLSGLTVAACGFAHLLASEEALFGVHHFTGNTPFVTPFGNTNHLAAFLTLTSTVALGLSLVARSRDSKLGWGLAALAMGVAVFLSMSRGGIGAFVVTWAVVGALVAARRGGGGLRGVLPWLIIGTTVAFALVLAFEELVQRAETVDSLSELRSTKIELWPAFARAGLSFWPAGMGAGAFELGFGRFQETQLHETFTHPENIALQWFTELGLVVSFALVAAAALAAWRSWRATRGHLLERIVLVAVVGVVLHDVFDFSLELNAVSVVAVVAVGLFSSVADGGRAVVKTPALVLVVALIGAAALAGWKGRDSHLDAEHALSDAIKAGQGEAAVRPLALALIDRHPADWVLFANMASFTATHGRAEEALAWVNRLLFLRPVDARAHVAAGQALLRLGKRTQALLEFKLSFELGDRSGLPLALAVAAKEGDFERLLIDQRGFIGECHRVLVARGDRKSASALLAAAVSAAPREELALEAKVLEVAALGDEDPARALEQFAQLPAAELVKKDVVLTRLRLLAKAGRHEEGVALAQPLLTATPADLELAYAMADLLEGLHRGGDARAVYGRTRPFVSQPRQRIELLLREASSWEAEGRWSKALDLLQSAVRLDPSRPDLHYHLAGVFEQLGSKRSASEAVRRGMAVDTVEGAHARQPWLDKLTAQSDQPWAEPTPDDDPR